MPYFRVQPLNQYRLPFIAVYNILHSVDLQQAKLTLLE